MIETDRNIYCFLCYMVVKLWSYVEKLNITWSKRSRIPSAIKSSAKKASRFYYGRYFTLCDNVLSAFFLLTKNWRGQNIWVTLYNCTYDKWVPYHFQILHIKNTRLKFTKYWFLKSGVSNSKCERSVLDIQPLKTNTRTHISFLVNANSYFSSKRCYSRFTL